MMLTKVRERFFSAAASTPTAGVLRVPVNGPLTPIIDKLAARWRCGPEQAAQRLIVLALTGWTPEYSDVIDRLSRFVPGHEDPFRRTCLMLRYHFDMAEGGMGEPIRACDRRAWLDTLLDGLQERRAGKQRAMLADLLADGALRAAGGASAPAGSTAAGARRRRR